MQPIRWIPGVLLLALMVSCVSTDYVGKDYTPTTNVDVFFSEKDVKRPYEVMGIVTAEATEYQSSQQIEQELVKQAMAHGADALLIGEMQTVEVGTTTTSTGHDSGDPEYYLTEDGKLHEKKKHDDWSSSTFTTEQRDKILKAKMLKYTD